MKGPNHSAGFNREQSIARWRESLLARETVTGENVRELEGHLRDGMSGLTMRGLSEEEAFWVTSRRLGGMTALAAEFETADPNAKWRLRAFWVVAGLLFGQFWFALTGMAQEFLRSPDTRVWSGRQPAALVADPMRLDEILARPLFMAGLIGVLFLFARGRLAGPLEWLTARSRDRRFLWVCAFGPIVLQIVWRWRFWLSLFSGDYFAHQHWTARNHALEAGVGNLVVLAWPLALALLLVGLAPRPATSRAITTP